MDLITVAATWHRASLGRTIALALVALATVACTGAAVPASPSPVPTSAALPSTPPLAPTPSAAPTPVAAPTAAVAEPVDVLTVDCSEGAPVVNAASVRAMRDGVHVAVNGTAGWRLDVETENAVAGSELEHDRQDLVLLIPPLDATLSCAPADALEPPRIDIRIEDPQAWYRPTEGPLPEGTSCVTGSGDYGEDARGETGDPVEIARALVVGLLRPGDIVERAGYPVEVGKVRIMRDGYVMGALSFSQDRHGGWLLESSTLCGGLHA